FDLTPILGPFFLLFFALCMGDAGYGIILTLFGTALSRKWIQVDMFKGLGPLITTLGVATFVVGIFLGTFFGISLPDAAWVPDWLKSVMITGNIAGFPAQMVLAVGIGVFHVCLAMVIKAIGYTRRFGLKANISTWGWVLLIVGGIILAGLGFLEVMDTAIMKVIVIVLGIVSGLAIYVFNTPGRNPLMNIGSGLWDTYNMATGLLGDILSYIRLYALGLAGGMLGNAFNILGGLVLGDGGLLNWPFFLLIVIFGHVLNLAMACLGAFVHPLRLTFVEFFKNSGYEGRGKAYKPLKAEVGK
ncbi:MAG: ATPase V, partial [Bacteroidales bacterium]|nr:ATPase V [Bacteroidales bacterium]